MDVIKNLYYDGDYIYIIDILLITIFIYNVPIVSSIAISILLTLGTIQIIVQQLALRNIGKRFEYAVAHIIETGYAQTGIPSFNRDLQSKTLLFGIFRTMRNIVLLINFFWFGVAIVMLEYFSFAQKNIIFKFEGVSYYLKSDIQNNLQSMMEKFIEENQGENQGENKENE